MNIEQCPCCGHAAEFRSVPYDRNPSEHKWTYNCFTGKSLAACPACGSFFTRDNISDKELSEFYGSLYRGTSAEPVDATGLYEFYPRFFSQALFLTTQINLQDGMRILEIGPNQVSALPAISLFCSPAYCYFEQYEFPVIKQYGGKWLGQYFSQEYIDKQAREDKFDLVLMSHSLEHVNPSSLHDTIRSLHAVLENNGHLFIEVPDQINGAKPPPHTLFFTIEGLIALLEGEGFRITGMQAIDGGVPQRYAHAQQGNVAGGNSSLLLRLYQKGIRFLARLLQRFIHWSANSYFMLKFFRPTVLRLILQDKLKELEVPYSPMPYLRVVARKVSG